MKNVIIIIIDAFRPKNISLFGYWRENDKNMKKIASESLLFKQFFSSSNATAPSLTSIFTGKYPGTHGIIHQFPYTQPEEIAKLQRNKKFWLPTFLQGRGYNTIAVDWIGLWFKDGFNYYQERQKKGGNKFLNIPFVKKFLLNLPSWAYKFGKKVTKARSSEKFASPDQTMDVALAQLKQSKKPFFLFVHFWDTHFPFSTIKNPKPCGEKNIKETLNKIKSNSQRDYFKKRIADIDLPSTQDMINKYDLAIETIDFQIGRLYKYLKKKNLWKDTVFVLLGDHGTNLIDHGVYFSSSSLYDDTIHVPMIMHLPGVEAKEINGFAQNIDVMPTIMEFLGYKLDGKIDGLSLMPLIKSDKEVRDKVFSWDGLSEDIRCVRTKKRKLIISRDSTCNLCKSSHHKEKEEYDLEKDPEEKKNIYSEDKDNELEKFLEEKKDVVPVKSDYF